MSTINNARDAFDAYHSGDHARCGKLLEQVGSFKNTFDVKVTHNTLINEYFKSGCSDPHQLFTQLSQAYDRARERDKKDKGRRKKDEDDEESYREDEDLSILRYNQALLCVQLRQYAQATLILEELFDNIEPIDDFLAIKICFLLLELCLTQREPEQAVQVLTYLEKPNAFLTVLRSERPAAKVIDTTPMDDGGDDLGEKGEDGGEPGAEEEVVALALPQPPAPKEREAPEGPLPSLTVGAFLPRHGRAPDTISRAEYRFFVLMYRARLAILLKNMKAAKKDSKSAMELLEQELSRAPLLTAHAHTTGKVDAPEEQAALEAALKDALSCQQHAMVNVLKAYLEYSRQNVRKAVKLLSLCRFNFAAAGRPLGSPGAEPRAPGADEDGEDEVPTDFHPAQDEACSPIFFNNMGCIHFMMHKPNLAAYYFQKALLAKGPQKAPAGLLSGKAGLTLPGVAASRNWLDRRAETAYNAGLQMLMSERPGRAFKCFEQCTPVFRTWPRLWVRLAECCIEMHRQSLTTTPGGAGEARGSDGSGNALNRLRSGNAAGIDCSGAGSVGCMGTSRQLAWGVQGSGTNRRWLLTTARSPPIGRPAMGEEMDAPAKAGEQRTGPAGAPAAPAAAPTKASDGERPPMTGDDALVHAAMYLRNALVLTSPMLPSAGAAGPSAAEGHSEAGKEAAGGSAGPQASAALRAAKSAPSSGSKAPGASAPGSSRHQAKDLVECEASLLEDVALVKLAYVCLCQHDHAAALRYSRRLLEKNYLVPQATGSEEGEDSRKVWKMQASNLPHSTESKAVAAKWPSSMGAISLSVHYAAEALLLAGKMAEVKALLGNFVSGNCLSKGLDLQGGYLADFERSSPSALAGAVASHFKTGEDDQPAGEQARAACGGLSPSSSVGGFTPPSYLLNCSGQQAGKEKDKGDADKEKQGNKDGGHASLVMYEPSVFPRLGDMQCMLYTNLAAVHCQDGNIAEAEKACEKALQVQPMALAPLRTLVYLLLRKGQNDEALRRLKESRSQPQR
eukprot:CAMPEP_0115050414 /NCGR_PEP_ID=MMETSP0227-20121206/1768_1 /TAXON_ID=89957 /ORGANISM="Polarella glacialis, Strain CCMP 1383" /LENGTH=1017 /DNA_ID=CAMNT_0002434261 /DNA_START=44 /DNA_END=3097 /DNA_ORIENTATION=+